MNTCSTCHWWFGTRSESAFRMCVWNTGTLDSNGRKIQFARDHPLETRGDFGCVDWQKDERVQVDE